MPHCRRHAEPATEPATAAGAPAAPGSLAPTVEPATLRPTAARPRGPVAVDPGAHNGPGPGRREGREAGVVVAGEADDLAAATCRSLDEQWVAARTGCGGVGRKRRKAILEHHDVVLVGGDLGRHGAPAGRTQWALVRWRHEGAVLPVAGDRDPVAGQGIQTDRPGCDARSQRTLVDHVAALRATSIRLRVVEVDQLAAVGQGGGGASNPREPSWLLGHVLDYPPRSTAARGSWPCERPLR